MVIDDTANQQTRVTSLVHVMSHVDS